MELTLGNLQNEYVDLVATVARGHTVEVRGMKTREITGATLIFPDLNEPMLPAFVGRKINTKLAAVETLDIIAGTSHADLVRRAAPEYGQVLVDPSGLDYGAYGPRLSAELQQCVTALRMDPSTRQAIATVWAPEDLTHVGDRPCTIFLQFLIRDDKLELHVTMRSNDVWLGTPYDVFAFTQLQQTVAYALDVPAGRYVHNTTSLHIYERDLAAAEQLSYTTTTAHALTREVLPHGVRPHQTETEFSSDVERRNFAMLQNTAFMLLAGVNVGSNGPAPEELPFLDDARWENQWYATRLEKLAVRKESV